MRRAGRMLCFVALVAMVGVSLRAQQSSTEKPASGQGCATFFKTFASVCISAN